MPDLLADLLVALRFFSRLPVPETARERALGATGLARTAALAPIAGAIVGLPSALVLIAAVALRLPAALAAPLAVVMLVLVTGALHEDALADCADGFGGGATRERKLEIMRDSRIGAYGACALALSLYLRATALTALAGRSPGLAALTIVAAAALSRAACLAPLALLAPARMEGVGAQARATPSSLGLAAAGAAALTLALLAPVAGLARSLVACGLVAFVALTVCGLAKRQIGGQTGDVAGAVQQLAEISTYLALASGG